MRSALALSNARVILQNDADCNRLIHEKVVRREQVAMIRGAGVDLQAFHPEPEKAGTSVIVLGARMLWHKGIGEFVEAARILRKQGVRARCVLVGKADPDNPASLSDEQLARWHEEGIVEWWGHREDMPHVLMHADVVVLPSYAEGLPKILLEACACGKPVVATSVDGCREIIKEGENGLLVPPKDAAALASAMNRLVSDAPTFAVGWAIVVEKSSPAPIPRSRWRENTGRLCRLAKSQGPLCIEQWPSHYAVVEYHVSRQHCE